MNTRLRRSEELRRLLAENRYAITLAKRDVEVMSAQEEARALLVEAVRGGCRIRTTADGHVVVLDPRGRVIGKLKTTRVTGRGHLRPQLRKRLLVFSTRVQRDTVAFNGLHRRGDSVPATIEVPVTLLSPHHDASAISFNDPSGNAQDSFLGTLIKEGKQAVTMTRLSCHRFRATEVRLWLSVIAYNLGNLWRWLATPKRIDTWLPTSLQQRLMKTGGRLVKHAWYYWLMSAERTLDAAAVWGDRAALATLSVPAG